MPDRSGSGDLQPNTRLPRQLWRLALQNDDSLLQDVPANLLRGAPQTPVDPSALFAQKPLSQLVVGQNQAKSLSGRWPPQSLTQLPASRGIGQGQYAPARMPRLTLCSLLLALVAVGPREAQAGQEWA